MPELFATPGDELVDEDLAEQRAHASLLARDAARAGATQPLDSLVARLTRRIGTATNWSLMRCGRRDFQITTEDGDSGYGDTAAAAVADLLARFA